MRVVVNAGDERVVLHSFDDYETWLATDGDRRSHTVATLSVVDPERETDELLGGRE